MKNIKLILNSYYFYLKMKIYNDFKNQRGFLGRC